MHLWIYFFICEFISLCALLYFWNRFRVRNHQIPSSLVEPPVTKPSLPTFTFRGDTATIGIWGAPTGTPTSTVKDDTATTTPIGIWGAPTGTPGGPQQTPGIGTEATHGKKKWIQGFHTYPPMSSIDGSMTVSLVSNSNNVALIFVWLGFPLGKATLN